MAEESLAPEAVKALEDQVSTLIMLTSIGMKFSAWKFEET